MEAGKKLGEQYSGTASEVSIFNTTIKGNSVRKGGDIHILMIKAWISQSAINGNRSHDR